MLKMLHQMLKRKKKPIGKLPDSIINAVVISMKVSITKGKFLGNCMSFCLGKNMPMQLQQRSGKKMVTKNFAACSAYILEIIIIRLCVFAEYQKLTQKKENWQCVRNVGAVVAPVLIEMFAFIIDIFRIFIRRILQRKLMIRRKSIEENLNDLLIKQRKQQHTQLPKEQFGLSLISYSNTFYGNFEKALMIVKKRIIDILFRWNIKEKENQIESLRESLTILTQDTEIVLDDGIITFYSEIVCKKQNEKSSSSSKNKSQLLSLYEKILDCMEILLRYYFVNKEYKQTKYNQDHIIDEKSQKRFVKSEKKVKNSNGGDQKSPKEIEDQLLLKIWDKMKEQSIQQLFNTHIKQQENEIFITIQICRICSQKIKLKNIEKHVNFCSKKSQLKSKLCQYDANNKNIQEKMRIKEKQLILSTKNNKQKEDFLHILRMIKESDSRDEIKRRSSLIGLNNNARLLDQLQSEVNAFTQNYGFSELLSEIVQSSRQKYFLEKKLENLERCYLNSENNDSDICSIISFTSSIQNPPVHHTLKTKKSLFAKISIPSESDNKSLSSCSIDSNGQSSLTEKEGDKFILNKSICLSLKSKDEESNKKVWKSMTCFKSQFNFRQQVENINLRSFSILDFLGKGAFGRVYLARRVNTTDLYALKFIKIKENQDEKDLELIKNEHEIFKKISGDHLVKAPFSFSEDVGHFFVLQYMPGGDLAKLLSQEVYFQEEQAKFYLAEIVLAIQHLHQYGIIHRDLKPQNLVLDSEGHLKLTDFGLSEIQIKKKIKMVRSINQCPKIKKTRFNNPRSALINRNNEHAKLIGTPDYIAPEIINRISTDNMSIDWWSLGVITYELLVGCRPFCGDTIEEVIQNITKFNIEWPQIGNQQGMISKSAYDLITKLLNKNFKERLGAINIEDIKNHSFFEGINWVNIKKSKPPFVPPCDMQRIQNLEEDLTFRSQIEGFSPLEDQSLQIKPIKLDKFIRYDLLKEQTIQSVGKTIDKKGKTLKKLKSIAETFTQPHIQETPRFSHKVDVENLI